MTARVKSVQWRILVRLLPLLALIFAGFLLWLSNHLTEALYGLNLELAQRSNEAVIATVQATMVTESEHGLWERLAERMPHHEATKIDVINTSGQVLLSTAQKGSSGPRDLDSPPCNACHANGNIRPAVDTMVVRDLEGEEFQVFAAPLHNSEECQTCHQDDGQKLGMVLVQQSLQAIQEQVSSAVIALASVGAVVLLVTMVSTRMVLGRYLNRPLRRLVAGARAIGAGDLQNTIELPEYTELAVLANTLNQSTARLASAQRELLESERLAAIGQTVAGLSHTLKNVLNGLRAGQYVLDRAVEKGDEEKLRKGLRVTKSSVRRVERLIFDMLYYVKERVPKREPVDPNIVIYEVIDELKDMADGLGVELLAEPDESIDMVALDRVGLFRAIVDLVTNAIDACTESESGNRVILRSRATPDKVILTVEDNGIGMSEEVLSNLYTRFFSTKASGGTGLGLHVVKKIVEEHGGSTEVESSPGKGSAFHIHLPRSTEVVDDAKP
jgi:signal transduction histidine kinase